MTDQAARLVRQRKPRFRRAMTWVAVRPVRMSAKEFFNPGDTLPALRRHYLQYLWRRNCIGPKGDPWTAYMLQSWADRQERLGASDAGEAAKVAEAAVADAPEPAAPAPAPEPEPEPEPEPVDGVELEELGGGWFRITKDGEEIAKTHGTQATNEWLEEHGYKKAF